MYSRTWLGNINLMDTDLVKIPPSWIVMLWKNQPSWTMIWWKTHPSWIVIWWKTHPSWIVIWWKIQPSWIVNWWKTYSWRRHIPNNHNNGRAPPRGPPPLGRGGTYRFTMVSRYPNVCPHLSVSVPHVCQSLFTQYFLQFFNNGFKIVRYGD